MRISCLTLISFCLCLQFGCITGIEKKTGHVRVHSDLVFSQEGHSDHLANWDFAHTPREQLMPFLRSLGMTDENILAELSDPFFTKPTGFIMFDTIEPTSKLAPFYENEFLFEGWTEKRRILTIETTNGGGDWLRVYEVKDKQVLIHIVGPWDDDCEAKQRGEFTGRTVIFQFLNCTGTAVFGDAELEKIKKLSLYGTKKTDKGL